MAEYEGNGDFSYTADGSSDFKRDFKQRDGGTSVKSDDENEEGTQVPEKVNEYVRELMAEKMSIDHKYPQAEKLIDAGMFVRNRDAAHDQFIQLSIGNLHQMIQMSTCTTCL